MLPMRYPASVTEADQANGDTGRELHRVGLCLDCLYSRRIQTPRGSTFYRCARAETDPSFPKYPRLPVVECAGYTRKL